MRRLSTKELTNGLFVQCKSPGSNSMSPVIYQILIEEDNIFYTTGKDWKMPGDFDIWYETELTKALNRDAKLTKIGI